MNRSKLGFYSIQILVEFGRDLLFFPLWWYSFGLFGLVKGLLGFLRDQEKSLALLVWIKNIFTPMYGQHDWQGVMISIFIRIFQIGFRSVLMLFWLLICLVLTLIWVAAPVYILYQLYFQFIYIY